MLIFNINCSYFLVTLNKIVEQSILATKLIADLAKKKSRFVYYHFLTFPPCFKPPIFFGVGAKIFGNRQTSFMYVP